MHAVAFVRSFVVTKSPRIPLTDGRIEGTSGEFPPSFLEGAFMTAQAICSMYWRRLLKKSVSLPVTAGH